jgi:hypothetical protein
MVAAFRCQKAANWSQSELQARGYDSAMTQKRLIRFVRHPAFAGLGVSIWAIATFALVYSDSEKRARLAIADDPVKIADRALDVAFNSEVAEKGIRSALITRKINEAQSFAALTASRNVPLDPALAEELKHASIEQSSVANTAGRFVRGFWTGEPTDIASFTGTAFGDLFLFGDLRDAAREGTHYLTGQDYDPWILGLAGIGIVSTAVSYTSVGAMTPERIGLTIFKAARRTNHLNPSLVARVTREAATAETAGKLLELGKNVGRIETKAGTEAALESLKIAEGPEDVSRLARLAEANGDKTLAIIKILRRGAIMLPAITFGLGWWLFWLLTWLFSFIMWLIWGAFAVIGVVSRCKASVERMTLRYIRWRKACRVRQAELHLPAVPVRL